MNNVRTPELLAPVGGMQQLRAAVQNGADAVYMGGSLFNARIKAENFSHQDMEAAICYAHDRNVRVYVTINTLIKDSELEKAFSYVNFLYEAGADAVILQDMGLARLVRKYLPDMSMHLSTQGTVYNKWAVESAKRLGFSRIVPAREMSLEEINEFAEECHKGKAPCEVEVFVHGALCMCYSGQCHMSRVIGGINGRSGNRGLCAQPCRLAYEDEKGRAGFLLSPKDICTVHMIPELCKAGIDSFKIEGRLKSPEYVAVVTGVYRRYLDMYRETGAVKVQEEDMHRLLQIFNRGGFASGYLNGNPGRKLLSGDSPKNQGIYVGKVKSSSKNSTLIDVKPDPKHQNRHAKKNALSMGDGVEIRGSNVTGNVISYIKKLNDGSVRIGDIKGTVRAGDKVYKVTDKELTSEARRSYENDFIRKVPVEMTFEAGLGKLPRLNIREAGRREEPVSVTVMGMQQAEEALNRPLDETRVKQQLEKLGDTVFAADKIDVRLEEGISLPISALNRLRREAVNALLEERRRIACGRKPLSGERIAEICRTEQLAETAEDVSSLNLSHSDMEPRREGLYIYSREALGRLVLSGRCGAAKHKHAKDVYVPLELYMEKTLRSRMAESAAENGFRVIPYILNVSKGALDKYIEDNFSDIVKLSEASGIMMGNLGWIDRFRKQGVKVYGDYGLNVYNRQSVKAFEEMGVEVRAYSHEADGYYSGRIPLMVTEHPVAAEQLTDRKGEAYPVMRWHSGDKYLIFDSREKERKPDGKSLMNYVV